MRRLSAELSLYLLKALAFCFRQYKHREENAKYTESPEYPERRVIADRLVQIAGEPGDEEGQEPADGDRYTGSLGLDIRGEHFTHNGPRQRAPAHAVSSNEDDERDHR